MVIALLVKFIYLLRIHMKQTKKKNEKKMKKKHALENLKGAKSFIQY